jgi:hypothetical protein
VLHPSEETSDLPVRLDPQSPSGKKEIPSKVHPAEKVKKQDMASPPMASVDKEEPLWTAQHMDTNKELKEEHPTTIHGVTGTEKSEQVIASLPSRLISPFDIRNAAVDFDIQHSVTRSKKSVSFLDPSVMVSGIAGQHGGLGAYAGAGLNMNISRRLSFNSGFGYRSFRPDASLFGGGQSANDLANSILNHDQRYEGIETYVDGFAVNAATGYNVINPLIQSLRQWQVSGGLSYRINHRFYTEGGVSIGFNTRAYSEYPIVSQEYAGASVKIGKSLNTYNIIRSTMTSVYGGMGYQMGDHIAVFAQWTHGLDSYLLNETRAETVGQPQTALSKRSDFVRGLNVGIKYVL